nr:RNA-directed DNA polymerase, eukaryota [Tanacetum cinerariifolium]
IKAIHGDDGKLDKDVIVGGQTCWTLIVKEARSLKGTGGVIKDLFPHLYALELHKHATVHMKLMAPSLDNSFRRRVRSGAKESQFNSLLEIVQVINLVPYEDRYFWSLESEGDYSVASIRKLIDEKHFQEWNVDYTDVSSYEEWHMWLVSIQIPNKLKSMMEGVFYGLWWSIRNFRNKLLFDNKTPKKALIFDNLVSLSSNWCKYRCKASFKWNDLLKNPYLSSV